MSYYFIGNAFTNDGFLKYSFRGTNPLHPDNEGLRKVMFHSPAASSTETADDMHRHFRERVAG